MVRAASLIVAFALAACGGAAQPAPTALTIRYVFAPAPDLAVEVKGP